MTIVIIDYGLSNLNSVYNTLLKIYKNVKISNDPNIIINATFLILPGVGTYEQGMKNINKLNLYHIIRTAVLEKNIPILGICLGMQLFSTYGYENKKTKGLDLIEGEVLKITHNDNLKLPHIGWNNIKHDKSDIFNKIPQNTDFYFIHSYSFIPTDTNVISATTNYHKEIVSLCVKDNIYGLQFHPEKSQLAGFILLKNIISKHIKI